MGSVENSGRNEINQTPDAPVITVTDFGKVNNEYLFNFTVHNPELDNVELLTDWGNGNTTGGLDHLILIQSFR